MEKRMRKDSVAVSRFTYQIVWVTEFRYHVLKVMFRSAVTSL